MGEAGSIEAWIHRFGPDHRPAPSELVTALRDAGLVVRELNGVPPAGPGLLLFEDLSHQLYDVLGELSQDGQGRVLAVAMRSSVLDRTSAWRLLGAGASDVLAWDQSPDPATDVAARLERWRAVDRLVALPAVRNNLVGGSPTWRAVLRQVVEAAAFTDASLLVTGESGTGKELVARLIHTLDRRPDKGDLVILDCTTVVPSLSGSEFFGHERGSFTGAVAAREGAFAMADGGTLFLDEVGELDLGLQAELLRVVQEGTYKRVGSNTWRRTRFRLICATNRDLVEEESRGMFRRDFYHRIAAWRCHLPSLRERTDDILPLANHFLRELRPEGEHPPELDGPVRDLLVTRDYPGNVRDLRQLVARIARRHVGPGPITVGDVPPEERPAGLDPASWPDAALDHSLRRALAQGVDLKEIGRATRETAIRIALAAADGNLQRASRALGVTDRALQLRRAAHLSAGPTAEAAAAASRRLQAPRD